MEAVNTENRAIAMVTAGLAGWAVPGGGYFVLGQWKRATIILVTIAATFLTGIYIGSIGVVDPVEQKFWYAAQIMTSPAVAIVGHITAGGAYPVYGRPGEVGQIYTSIAGLMNLLCVVNCVHLAHIQCSRT